MKIVTLWLAAMLVQQVPDPNRIDEARRNIELLETGQISVYQLTPQQLQDIKDLLAAIEAETPSLSAHERCMAQQRTFYPEPHTALAKEMMERKCGQPRKGS